MKPLFYAHHIEGIRHQPLVWSGNNQMDAPTPLDSEQPSAPEDREQAIRLYPVM